MPMAPRTHSNFAALLGAGRWIGFSMVVAFAVSSGCKESEGNYCQVDSDCRSDLICNRSTDTCQLPGSANFDASFEPDARLFPIDAPPVAPDAAVDASVIDAPAQ